MDIGFVIGIIGGTALVIYPLWVMNQKSLKETAEIEKRDLDRRNLVLMNELEASTAGRELYLAQNTTLRRENDELLSANEFLNAENDDLLDDLEELKKKK